MGIPEEIMKESLGQAYVHAVAARAGYNIARPEKDFGLDGTIKDVARRNGRFHETGFGIEYQLKSSCDVLFENGQVIYDLESKNYNDLALWTGTLPAILILFVLPKEKAQWLVSDISRLEIRQCAWWCSLEKNPPTSNSATRRITIPQSQVFSPNALEKMMDIVRGGNRL